MRKIALLFVIIATAIGVVRAQKITTENLKRHVYTLADDSMQGRLSSTMGGLRAAQYIVCEFERMGVRPLNDTTYYQHFEPMSRQAMCSNVIAIVDGVDLQLKNEYIVVGAHYDHLGFRQNTDNTLSVYNGADDNASGVATMLEVARNLLQDKPKRSVIFVAFDAEEMGLLGSKHFVESGIVPINSIKMMFSIDMVGGLRYGKKLEYCIGGGDKNFDSFRVKNPHRVPLVITTTDRFIGTDSDSFIDAGVPGVYVNTGFKTPYHQFEDDADMIDYDGLEQVANHFYSVLMKVCDRKNKINR